MVSLSENPSWISNWPTILSLLGNVFLGLIALFKEDFLYWKNKPKIKVGLGNNEPQVIQTFDNIGNFVKYFRLKILNEGKTVAKNCKVKLISVYSKNKKEIHSLVEPDLLKWSSAPLDTRYCHENTPFEDSKRVPIHREKMNIPPRGGFELCDLFVITTGNNLMFLSSAGRNASFEDKEYIITLEVSGENFKPKIVEIKLSNPRSFEKIYVSWRSC